MNKGNNAVLSCHPTFHHLLLGAGGHLFTVLVDRPQVHRSTVWSGTKSVEEAIQAAARRRGAHRAQPWRPGADYHHFGRALDAGCPFRARFDHVLPEVLTPIACAAPKGPTFAGSTSRRELRALNSLSTEGWHDPIRAHTGANLWSDMRLRRGATHPTSRLSQLEMGGGRL